ncbi:probable cytochrome P450 49a1 isoform X2 [Fopius arisanus]|uniref:Probable cytochrome P450 49a1 isoform X2 n=1 Tax=Fopius arisanus TaxID=64838 RepID=A0A9R1SYZ9_9HYME|nr:PREDICTED: probable cytochrome P450 49a1 isoform X2 [Fopius arisanus]
MTIAINLSVKTVLIRNIFTRNLCAFAPVFDENVLSHVRPYSELPGPKPIFFFGNTWRFIPFIGDFNIQEIDKVSSRLYRDYGDIVKVSGLMGRPDMVFLYDANEIKRIFKQEEKMPYRPSMSSLNYYKHVLRKDFFTNACSGVIATHGEGWYQFRTKVQQVMLQPRIANMYIGNIEEASIAFLKRIRMIKDYKDEVPDDFINEINKWALESIAHVALDVRLRCMDESANVDTQKLITAIHTVFTNVGILELKIPFWKVCRTPTWNAWVEALDNIFNFATKYTEIALEKSKNRIKGSELSLLERVLKMDVNNGHKLAAVLALDLFLTATAVGSILYQLARNPEKQAILYDELMQILPREDMQINCKHLQDLKYVKACIRETLRMHPVVIGNGRCMTRDTIIKGYRIPKGVQVIFQHYVISNQEKYFANSNEFYPERWLQENTSRHAFASLPFGYGRRMCLGKRFADLELVMVISKILQKFKLEYHHRDLDYHINPLYTPKGPLKIKFIAR